MEKEKNVTASKEEVKVENEVEVKELKTKDKLFLQREPFVGKDGKEYFSYVIRGKVRDRDVKIDFAPKDKGGYEVLDIIYEIGNKVELVMAVETMKSNDGTKTKYDTYKAVTDIGDGQKFECSIKPSQDSDKALLKMLLICMGGAK